MQAVLFRTFKSYAGAAHFGHSEAVVCLDTKHFFYAFTLCFRMRFGSDKQGLQFRITRINALLQHYLIQTAGVTWYGMQGGGSEIGNEFNLPKGVACSGRYGKHTQTFCSVLEAQPSGKHAVAGGILKNIGFSQTNHVKTSRHGFRPLV